MNGRALVAAGAAVIAPLMLCTAGLASLFMNGGGAVPCTAAAGSEELVSPDAGRSWPPRPGSFDLVSPAAVVGNAHRESAYPHPYSQGGEQARTPLRQSTDALIACLPAGPGGWVVPVAGPVVSGFRTPERPGHDGIDIAAPKGSVIRAASDGVITVIACNASLNGQPYSCDVDGSPSVRGCGWYSEITHPGGVITRYCHQLIRPPVEVGQQIHAGQPIGVVGTSGHSSGPHLHFEVHLNSDPSPAGAVDPAVFLAAHGAPPGA